MGFLRYGTLFDSCYAEFWKWNHLSDLWAPILKLENCGPFGDSCYAEFVGLGALV